MYILRCQWVRLELFLNVNTAWKKAWPMQCTIGRFVGAAKWGRRLCRAEGILSKAPEVVRRIGEIVIPILIRKCDNGIKIFLLFSLLLHLMFSFYRDSFCLQKKNDRDKKKK